MLLERESCEARLCKGCVKQTIEESNHLRNSLRQPQMLRSNADMAGGDSVREAQTSAQIDESQALTHENDKFHSIALCRDQSIDEHAEHLD